MLVKDVMTPRPELVNRRATAQDAARKMLDLDIGVMPVVDRHHVVGMVTDRDLAVRCVAPGMDPTTTPVEAVMTPQVVCIGEDEDVRRLVTVMEEHGLRRIVVTNAKGKPVGIVSLSDVAARGDDGRMVAEALAPWAHHAVPGSHGAPAT